jgi:hypothetical protein
MNPKRYGRSARCNGPKLEEGFKQFVCEVIKFLASDQTGFHVVSALIDDYDADCGGEFFIELELDMDLGKFSVKFDLEPDYNQEAGFVVNSGGRVSMFEYIMYSDPRPRNELRWANPHKVGIEISKTITDYASRPIPEDISEDSDSACEVCGDHHCSYFSD